MATGPFALALLLAGLAGWVDAAGLSGASDLFVSFMSGNTTIGGLAIAHQDWARLGEVGAVLGCFVGGVIMGELLDGVAGQWGTAVVLLAEAAILGIGTWTGMQSLHPRWEEVLPLAFGMGLQNAAMHSAGGINVGLTYITGTLVQFGRTLAALLRGRGDPARAARFFGLWFSLALGAALSGFILALSRSAALGGASCVALCLAGVAGVIAARRRHAVAG